MIYVKFTQFFIVCLFSKIYIFEILRGDNLLRIITCIAYTIDNILIQINE